MRITILSPLIVVAAIVAFAPANAAAALTFPDGDIVREGLGSTGANVEWTTPTLDGGDAIGTPNCSPRSGSVFPVGTTKVECTVAVRFCPPGPQGASAPSTSTAVTSP